MVIIYSLYKNTIKVNPAKNKNDNVKLWTINALFENPYGTNPNKLLHNININIKYNIG